MNKDKQLKEYLDYLRLTKLTQEEITFNEWLAETEDTEWKAKPIQ